jgi:hypothetical protein
VRFDRIENPPLFEHYRNYRPYLRRDFLSFCAYCERNEYVLGGEDFFEIDHFRPVNKFTALANYYPNLYYTCAKCNRYKGSTWPSDSELSRGFRFADPCQEDMYEEHFEESAGGQLLPKTNCGAYTLGHIRLDRPDLLMWRQTRTRIGSEIRVLESLVVELSRMTKGTSLETERESLQLQVEAVQAQITRLREQYC